MARDAVFGAHMTLFLLARHSFYLLRNDEFDEFKNDRAVTVNSHQEVSRKRLAQHTQSMHL